MTRRVATLAPALLAWWEPWGAWPGSGSVESRAPVFPWPLGSSDLGSRLIQEREALGGFLQSRKGERRRASIWAATRHPARLHPQCAPSRRGPGCSARMASIWPTGS